MVIFFYLCFALLVGAIGSNRMIGFGLSFMWALVLSPIIGLIIVLFSEKKSDVRIYELQKSQMRNSGNSGQRPLTVSEKLEELKQLRNNGDITLEEFKAKKDRLIQDL